MILAKVTAGTSERAVCMVILQTAHENYNFLQAIFKTCVTLSSSSFSRGGCQRLAPSWETEQWEARQQDWTEQGFHQKQGTPLTDPSERQCTSCVMLALSRMWGPLTAILSLPAPLLPGVKLVTFLLRFCAAGSPACSLCDCRHGALPRKLVGKASGCILPNPGLAASKDTTFLSTATCFPSTPFTRNLISLSYRKKWFLFFWVRS